jgi:hypothetical protein
VKRTGFCMPRKKRAVRYAGRCPAPRQGGYPPETPGPLSLLPHVPERSSPSRVRFAAQKPRALDGSGPFRRFPEIRESGQMQSAPACGRVLPPVGRPRAARQVWSRQTIIGDEHGLESSDNRRSLGRVPKIDFQPRKTKPFVTSAAVWVDLSLDRSTFGCGVDNFRA